MDPFDDDIILDDILEDYDCLEDVLEDVLEDPDDLDEELEV